MRRQVKTSRRGDTLIEVMLSISIFALVAMITINMMNDGINTAQRTLEAEMARNEIDAQAEALRYIHNNYVAERQKLESESQFRKIWNKLISKASRPGATVAKRAETESGKSFDINDMNSCEEPYAEQAHLQRFNAFVLNTRLIMPELSTESDFKYLGYNYNELTDLIKALVRRTPKKLTLMKGRISSMILPLRRESGLTQSVTLILTAKLAPITTISIFALAGMLLVSAFRPRLLLSFAFITRRLWNNVEEKSLHYH